MKPTRAQRFFAARGPFQVLFFLLFVGAPVCLAYAAVKLLAPAYQPLSNIWNLVQLVFFVIVALLLGLLLALVVGGGLIAVFWLILRPIYKARESLNGAPFRVGDRVQILVGRYRGRVVRVYSDWRDDSVRVDLGERERKKFRDIYSAIELLREEGDGVFIGQSTQPCPASGGVPGAVEGGSNEPPHPSPRPSPH